MGGSRLGEAGRAAGTPGQGQPCARCLQPPNPAGTPSSGSEGPDGLPKAAGTPIPAPILGFCQEERELFVLPSFEDGSGSTGRGQGCVPALPSPGWHREGDKTLSLPSPGWHRKGTGLFSALLECPCCPQAGPGRGQGSVPALSGCPCCPQPIPRLRKLRAGHCCPQKNNKEPFLFPSWRFQGVVGLLWGLGTAPGLPPLVLLSRGWHSPGFVCSAGSQRLLQPGSAAIHNNLVYCGCPCRAPARAWSSLCLNGFVCAGLGLQELLLAGLPGRAGVAWALLGLWG